MNIIQLAVKILGEISLGQQKRFVKYVPATGNVYVYKHTPTDGTSGCVSFSHQVEFLSGSNRKTFIWCALTDSTDETATFEYHFEDVSHEFTVHHSRLVIVD